MDSSSNVFNNSTHNLCRTCLNTKNAEELHPLFNEQLYEIVMELASIKVSKDDGLPSVICMQCVLQASIAYSFKKQCERTDCYLKRVLYSNKEQHDVNRSLNRDYFLISAFQKHNLRKVKSETNLSEVHNMQNLLCSNEKALIRSCTNLLKLISNDVNSFSIKELLAIRYNVISVDKSTQLDESMIDSEKNVISNSTLCLENNYIKHENVVNTLARQNTAENKIYSSDEQITLSSKKHKLNTKDKNTLRNDYFLDTSIIKLEPLDSLEDSILFCNSKKKCDNKKRTEDTFTKKKIYKCKECNRKFSMPGGLKVHLAKHGKKQKCKVCKMEFTFSKEWKEHIKTHPDYRPYNCKICKKKFNSTGTLSKHIRTHGGERKHLCNRCGKRFYEPGHLMVHMRTHTGEKPIVCAICGKRFSDRHGLAAHNKIHTGEKNHECGVCHKRFAHSFVLKAHLRVHTGEKPFICSVCGAAFGSSSYLTIHMRSHTQERPYKCTACPKSFTSKGALTAHTMTHTGEKRFQCSVCGKRAARAADLTTHMRSHTGEKPYACDQCPKRYHTSSNLAAHKRSHSGTRNYVCSECGKAFIDARTLQCHIRTHTGERPYVCQYCGKRFTQSGQLAAHRKTHIQKTPTLPSASQT